MSYSYKALKGDVVLPDLKETIRYRKEFAKQHPEYMNADGLILFCGGQGAGKTLSAVRYLSRLVKEYPEAVVVSNISLNIGRDILPYSNMETVSKMDNGYAGIILFLDEIQVEFNSSDWIRINPSVIQTMCQQRKRRLHIIGTTQLFKRLAKQFREQCNAIIDCKSILKGAVQINSVVDLGTIAEDANGNLTTYDYSDRMFWFRAKRYFDMYDTFERVSKKGENK